ncbi:MAG: hypothetical protein JSR36_12350 [Proteobacteria bacterium]|nr:hypothetical protein [Pseudomonadota bacterium]
MLRIILILGVAALGGAAIAARSAAAASTTPARGCLAGGNGYLRATIRGAASLDVNWNNAEMECEGGPRPDGTGVRVAFAGPRHPDGRRLRLVFGVESLQEGRPARDLPTNLTVIFEGEERLFATRGDDHCTVDELHQERVGNLGGAARTWRIVARGFCVAPASSLTGDARILVSSFDFAGVAAFEDAGTAPPPEQTL